MNSNVLLQMLGESESFVAVVAAKGPLVGVDHLMSVEILEQGKPPAASFTLMRTRLVA